MAWYRTGTVSATNGSTTVTGVGTAFVSNVSVGEGIVLPDGRTYEIAAVVSNTQLTLATPYLGATQAGQAYAILPTASFARDLALQAAALVNSFASVRDGVGQGLFPDGTAGAPAFRFSSDQDTGIHRAGTNALGLDTGGLLRLTINSNGHCGIGYSSPAERLHVEDTGPLVARFKSSSEGVRSVIRLNAILAGSQRYADIGIDPVAEWLGFDAPTAGSALIGSGGAPDMIIAAGGNVGIGTTSATQKLTVAGIIAPSADNTYSLGTASLRASVVYAGTGAINTSDEREKQQIETIPDEWLDAWGEVQWCRFRFNEAVAEKGEDARWHIGQIAQQIRDAFSARSLDATTIGLLCFDEWDELTEPVFVEIERTRLVPSYVPTGENDEAGNPLYIVEMVEEPYVERVPTGETRVVREAGDRWGLRYEECQAMEAAWQRRETARLQARIEAMENA